MQSDRKRKAKRKVSKAEVEARVKSIDPFILKMAIKYARAVGSVAVEVDDLVAEGRMGAMVAAHKFEKARGFRFLTYAGHWVRHHMLRYIQNHARLIRVPVHISSDKKRTHDASSFAGANELIRKVQGGGLRSIDERVGGGESDLKLGETIADSAPTPEEVLVDKRSSKKEIDVIELSRLLLSERELRILDMRAAGKTLDQTGRSLGLSRERVRQVEVLALAKLRDIVQLESLGEDT